MFHHNLVSGDEFFSKRWGQYDHSRGHKAVRVKHQTGCVYVKVFADTTFITSNRYDILTDFIATQDNKLQDVRMKAVGLFLPFAERCPELHLMWEALKAKLYCPEHGEDTFPVASHVGENRTAWFDAAETA